MESKNFTFPMMLVHGPYSQVSVPPQTHWQSSVSGLPSLPKSCFLSLVVLPQANLAVQL